MMDDRVTLTEGSVIERLRRDPAIELDPHVLNAGLVCEPAGRETLASLYRGYLDIGCEFNIPMLVGTPTWRANPERLRAVGLAGENINEAACRLLMDLRATYNDYANRTRIAGLMGCAGDAYDPKDALNPTESARFHHWQAQALADAGVDYLMAATLPAACEAEGMARAMATTGLPYILSFVIRPSGDVLDDTPLADVIDRIDRDVQPAPLAYMVNCVHPEVFVNAIDQQRRRDPDITKRVIGLQANTSRLSPEELDSAAELIGEDPETFAAGMLEVYQCCNSRILGGCCGTDERHLRAIAQRL